ncbi:hypothetical protein E2C01_021009 [Portunus trituberculatus]|uniref:Uncharacterized protein n=1 Tax=Portunus trituberculatus TaxID=210409 RepID=A0A5B7E4Y1_PORTR|nr:hypothetical protein [Portunus trituberculatus]
MGVGVAQVYSARRGKQMAGVYWRREGSRECKGNAGTRTLPLMASYFHGRGYLDVTLPPWTRSDQILGLCPSVSQ